jgi:hypothetical protein
LVFDYDAYGLIINPGGRNRGAIKRGFRTPEVVKLTGLTCRQLDHWDRTGFVRPGHRPAGRLGEGPVFSGRRKKLRL